MILLDYTLNAFWRVISHLSWFALHDDMSMVIVPDGNTTKVIEGTKSSWSIESRYPGTAGTYSLGQVTLRD